MAGPAPGHWTHQNGVTSNATPRVVRLGAGSMRMLIGQLSDPHVRPQGVLYQGVVDSNQALIDAIDHLLAMDRQPDVVVVTGDIVDEGRAEEYAMARELLSRLPMPYLVIPGNHDPRENFRTAFADHTYLPPSGALHYCVDEYRYIDSGRLASVLARHNNIDLVLCGHVHRPVLRRWAGTVVCACPSTVTEIDLQLQPSARPSSHAGPRGCMLHLWDPQLGMLSHTSLIGTWAGPYPFA